MAGYRAFGNKIWNATRFVLTKAGHGRVDPTLSSASADLDSPERWILHRLEETSIEVTDSLEKFRFDLACRDLYQLLWSDFCDWYIEMAKPGLEGADARPRVADVLMSVLERALRLLHPVMPHLTEELWQRLPGHEAIHEHTICLAPWPLAARSELAAVHEDRTSILRSVTMVVRNERADRGLPPKAEASMFVGGDANQAPDELSKYLTSAECLSLLRSLCRVSAIRAGLPPGQSKHRHVRQGVGFTPVFEQQPAGIDLQAVRTELAEVEANLERVRARLGNAGFTDKAPPAVVEGARRQLAELEARRERLAAQIERGSGD
jgi:valyl-tRNA synthetase